MAAASTSEAELDLDECLRVATAVAAEAGAILAAGLARDDKEISHKGVADIVTDTDRAVEAHVSARLRAAFPSHGFVGEETSARESLSGGESDDVPTWINDPIDGTTNFARASPHCCVSLALAHRGRVVLGVVHAPLCRETFVAARGRGATLNGSPIRVSQSAALADAIVATNFGYGRDAQAADFMLGNIRRLLLEKAFGLRVCGSAALELAYVACGRLCCFYEWGIHVWDIAAGALLVEEAGGVVLDPNSGSACAPCDLTSRRICAGNPAIARAVNGLLEPKTF